MITPESGKARSRSQMKLRRTPHQSSSKSIPTEAWPPVGEWRKCKQALATQTFRRLGIGPNRDPHNGIWCSQVFEALGVGSFAQFPVIRSPGKVIWCNFELARQLGFKVPRSNQLSPQFHDELVTLLSFRAVGLKDGVSDRETVTMFADRYGGDGVNPALGAGRAGFLPYGNLYVKGVGFTPLFKHSNPYDFVHSHGGVHLEDCLTEAIFGEVNHNLFSQGSIRMLAIVDQGRHVTEPSGRQRHIALAVRAGSQLRPGHLLGRPGRPSQSLLDKFVAITRATHQLVVRMDELTGDEIPDVAATMLRIVDDHARTGADGFRWRVIHGAISASNMEMSGAMLDLPTQSAQPRTAPVWTLDYAHSVFGEEHKERAFQLFPMYQKLLRRTPPAIRLRFNMKWLNIPSEMDRAYREHLEVKLLSAAGLKMELAEQLQSEQPELASHFADVIVNMSRLRNPGSVSVSRALVESVSVLDVFHLLHNFPALHFKDPNGDNTGAMLSYLKPVYRGNRFHVTKKKATVAALVREFASLYGELMVACVDYARKYYGSVKRMQASIIARAAFENEPLDQLYYRSLYENMNKAIADYQATGDAEIVSKAINHTISASLRSVDALLIQGDSRRLPEGGVELQMRTIDGVDYSVRAWNDKTQTRRLHVRLPLFKQGKYLVTAIPGLQRMTKRQIQSLRYRFTTNEWKSSRVVSGRLANDERDGLNFDFENLSNPPAFGRIEGYCYLGKPGEPTSKTRRQCFGGYTFAIPDRQELWRLFCQAS